MNTDDIAVIAIRDKVEILERGRSAGLRVHWERGAFRSIDGHRIALAPTDDWEVYPSGRADAGEGGVR